MKSQRRTIRHETVLNYLSALTEAFLVSKVPRYDIRGRGYDVTIGKAGPAEADFAARRQEDTIYIQVATTIAAPAETRRREYAPLEAIADNHPKYVITLDPLAGDNTGGIRHLPIHDFLLSDAY